MEHWLPIAGYEGLYEVSDFGRVKSLARTVAVTSNHGTPCRRRIAERILKSGGSPYLQVMLCRDGQIFPRSVHELVLTTFVHPRPPGQECCHLDNVKTNNRLNNLIWDTLSENQRDRHRIHCAKGHLFTPENTVLLGNGGKRCRECYRQWVDANHDVIKAMKREWARRNYVPHPLSR